MRKAAEAQVVGRVPAEVDAAIGWLRSGRPDIAEPLLQQVLKAAPGHVDAQMALAGLRGMQGRYMDAVRLLSSVLKSRPDDVSAWMNLGTVQLLLKRFDKALSALDRALALMPDQPEAHANRARALVGLKRFGDGGAAFERAWQLDPTNTLLLSHAIEMKRKACAWAGLGELESRLLDLVRSGHIADPLSLTQVCDDPELQYANARRNWGRNVARSATAAPPRRLRAGAATATGGRIRLGYMSYDFREHAVAYLIAQLIELHDRNRYEVIGFSYGFDDHGPTRRRLKAAFDRFVDVEALDEAAMAAKIADSGIDILVDLNAYTPGTRTGVLARRPAPVQCQYLGYPGTLGAAAADYVIGDRVVSPESSDGCFGEAVVRLPWAYQANDRRRAVDEPGPSRKECGLPDGAFVLCCFNSQQKMSPVMLDVWARVLARVPGSVLWLFSDNLEATGNLRREAKARGIEEARLVIAGFMQPPARHRARLRHADLHLDTLPYGAHTTASDALWVGVPTLTCQGKAFPGRVGASLAEAARVPELIVDSLEAYEELAVALAGDRQRVAALRARLTASRLEVPLFDSDRFRRDIELAYETMWQRHRQGLAPASFTVPDFGPLPAPIVFSPR